ncbi:hypothetical protein ACNHKD_11765 [Methylocystis sp. JAN1]|uniref:hypothetical protein n=1 Tax=Methylocystis sp. JAN1 TaxID=3397211 RepID=UPI003FA1D3A3
MGSLEIQIENLDSGEIELVFRFRSNDFYGASSTWFSIKSIDHKIDRFLDYPLNADDQPEISGGYGENNRIVQEHVYLTVAPFGRTGTVKLTVRLASHRQEPTDMNLGLQGEFLTNYQQLSDFVRDFKLLLAGKKERILIESNK